MKIQLKLPCQSARKDNTGHFTMFFEDEAPVPAVLLRLPQGSEPCVPGQDYLITVECAPGSNGMNRG